ncbi:MAG: hypothetical protein HRU18_16465 [Pseudoalteromonas sp.]|uniref:CBASS cGAMP synthase n=1 Tax=Pseudoalteromonas sp. TaxID=53249 RepID=UPI001D5F9D0E|nr:CBASS cGAMP synthase [Pseudoalteromonas sp.]NRA79801.1 hypothetical protein [Pseudoalteromonas sp.]
MLKFSINKLLSSSGLTGKEYYLDNLRISDEIRSKLVSLRDDARSGILEAWSYAKEQVKQDKDLYERVPLSKLEQLIKLKPRFKMQGSYVYGTIVEPAHNSQDIDLDDGMYIPMSVVQLDDKTMSAAMFEVVDKVLKTMANANGWKQIPKKTCSRLQTNEGIHLDIPCYAIPDEDFNRLRLFESLLVESNSAQDSELKIHTVNLALRNGEWLESNPEHIKEWVSRTKKLHPNFQDIVMIVKGLRDHNYTSGGPSSISLMVAIEKIMSSSPKLGDLTEELYNVVQKLSSVISNELKHPHPGSAHLIIHSPTEPEKQDLRLKFDRFAMYFKQALVTSLTERETMDILINLFGFRMPNDQTRVIRYSVDDNGLKTKKSKVMTPIQEHNTFG